MSSPTNQRPALQNPKSQSPDFRTLAQRHLRKLIDKVLPPPPVPSDADMIKQLRAALKKSATPFGASPKPEPDRVFMMRSAARSTQIVGHMLDSIADDYSFTKKPAAFIVRLGRIAWAVVEAAVPRSIMRLLMRYWFSVLLIAEIVMIAGGTLISKESAAQGLGLKLLVLTLGFRALIEITRLYLGKRRIGRILAGLVLVVVSLFVWWGTIHFRKVVVPDLQKWVIAMKERL